LWDDDVPFLVWRVILFRRFLFLLCALSFCQVVSAQVSVVIPIVNCVEFDASTDTLTVYFGYINTGTSIRFISAGFNNMVDPAPNVRPDQPTSFLSGRHDFVWSTTQPITDASPSLTWTIFGITATATNDPSLYCSTACAAPAGPAGATGPQGPEGPEGAEGPTGPQGSAGPAGEQGVPGPTGPTGPQGPQGLTGSKGDIGPQGLQGPEGPQGPPGPAGPSGPAGEPGPQGPQGAIGPDGPQGEQGLSGPIGPAGPQGSQGPEGPAGPAGAIGPRGPQGESGPAGADGRIATWSARSSEIVAIGNTPRAVLSLRVDAERPSTLLVLGAVSVSATGTTRIAVVIDGKESDPVFRTDVRDAVIPLPIHCEQAIGAGSHSIEVRVWSESNVDVSERIVTALVYEELE
jgi:hypothetical protein